MLFAAVAVFGGALGLRSFAPQSSAPASDQQVAAAFSYMSATEVLSREDGGRSLDYFASANRGVEETSDASARVRQRLSADGESLRDALSSTALGQLKLAAGLSSLGAGSRLDDRARQHSTEAFEQGRAGGYLGAGAPGLAYLPPLTYVKSVNVTPYQGEVDRVKEQIDSGWRDIQNSRLLAAAGMGVTWSGMLLTAPEVTRPLGLALIAVGIAILALSEWLLWRGMRKMGNAKGRAAKITVEYGQVDQGRIIAEAADRAAGWGLKQKNTGL
jgi:hypothetical protein